jgi:hypothetical protein
MSNSDIGIRHKETIGYNRFAVVKANRDNRFTLLASRYLMEAAEGLSGGDNY